MVGFKVIVQNNSNDLRWTGEKPQASVSFDVFEMSEVVNFQTRGARGGSKWRH